LNGKRCSGGIEDAAEDRGRDRLELRDIGEGYVELLARARNVLVEQGSRTHREDRERPCREPHAVPAQEPARVRMQSSRVQGVAEDDALVAVQAGDLVGRPQLGVEAVCAQPFLRDLSRRALLGRVGSQTRS
jgi:hypothetical protein